jgi:hypothetical protein
MTDASFFVAALSLQLVVFVVGWFALELRSRRHRGDR